MIDRLATFARSDAGSLYRRVCERFSVDPAAGFDDDVLAYNFRLALAVVDAHSQPEPSDERDDEFAATRRMEAWMKAQL